MTHINPHRVNQPHKIPSYTSHQNYPKSQPKKEGRQATTLGAFVNVLKGLLPKKDEGKNGNIK